MIIDPALTKRRCAQHRWVWVILLLFGPAAFTFGSIPSSEVSLLFLAGSGYHADEQGSTMLITDAAGNVTDQLAYYSYGGLINRTGTTGTPITWLGGVGVLDENDGLYLMQRRYYRSDQKRFLSADPVGIDSFPNLYAYANLNPAFFVDPYGLCAESDLSYQMRVFGETGAMTAARTFASPSTARTGMDTLQTGIAALSALDPTPVTPAVNAMISIARGNTAMAAMSVVAMIPLMGEAERLGVAGERLGVQAMGTAGEAEAFAGIREASQFLRGAGVPRAARVQILQSFEASTVQVDQAGANQFGIRYFGGNANEVGSFLFDTFPASRQSLALRPEFNAMTGFRQLQIRPAANVISGRVAAQGVGFEGGQMQRFILNPEENLLFP